jgi:DNA-binding transcriptional LysR family regulator
MNLRQIRYFLALCEEQNFTRAARRCRVSQPSLTNAIKALETTLGGQLFDRKPFVRPSELAKVLRPHFESIVEAVDVTPQIVASISARPPNVVSFGGHGGLRFSPGPSLAVPGSRLRSPSSPDPTEPPRETAGKPSPQPGLAVSRPTPGAAW